ncbi:hypothetical protein SAMN02745157_1163 [Kaistia soli DSM 19436]|uniref:BAAT/Acyl-CoA thioester hydrolase C-terminal domain-containing protein n=1 Tax=Kaistia soli DSM 19436 TaxID=1122133 RepID=A0A1M4X6K6_9HYPH|nr:acyl-CoA thioester hydrolase/BAAT C-terminal domain-containing protein [Kaistia soli]SHE89109.1 hypothetical protein SAMN02745157_1163 [Kaistia soli DSM 19436]
MRRVETPSVTGWLTGETRGRTGVVVLGGSSGRVDVSRAELFAAQGTAALALQWFGGPGQAQGICEIPIETFIAATDHLAALDCRRIVYVGTSKGAEAALLAAVHDPRIDAVIAISPSSVVWGNIGPGLDGISWPERSSWTLGGSALPFVPADPTFKPPLRENLKAYRTLFEHSLSRFESLVETATIRIEDARADTLLVAGGDDALWPSDRFAEMLVARAHAAGRTIDYLTDPDAGHRVLLPGETTKRSSLHAHGGSDVADARLGAMAWDHAVAIL